MKRNGSPLAEANEHAPDSPAVDIEVSHPRDGQMRLVSRYFFADPKADPC